MVYEHDVAHFFPAGASASKKVGKPLLQESHPSQCLMEAVPHKSTNSEILTPQFESPPWRPIVSRNALRGM